MSRIPGCKSATNRRTMLLNTIGGMGGCGLLGVAGELRAAGEGAERLRRGRPVAPCQGPGERCRSNLRCRARSGEVRGTSGAHDGCP